MLPALVLAGVFAAGCGSAQPAPRTTACTEPQPTGPVEMSFVGRAALEERVLRAGLRTGLESREGCFQEQLERDLLMLHATYYDHGYLTAQIAPPEVTTTADGTRLTVRITEGKQFAAGTIAVRELGPNGVEVEPLMGRQRAREMLRLSSGQTFRRHLMAADLATVIRAYRDAGYADAEANPAIELDEQRATADVDVVIRRGLVVHIERVEIHGARAQESVRAQIVLKESDSFSETKLEQSLDRLRASKRFARIDAALLPGSAPDRRVLSIEVQE